MPTNGKHIRCDAAKPTASLAAFFLNRYRDYDVYRAGRLHGASPPRAFAAPAGSRRADIDGGVGATRSFARRIFFCVSALPTYPAGYPQACQQKLWTIAADHHECTRIMDHEANRSGSWRPGQPISSLPCKRRRAVKAMTRDCVDGYAGSSIALRMMIMKPFLAVSRRHWFWLAASLALFFSALTGAEAACPNWVETTSGSVFNIAALIADAGSAQFALERVKRALSKVDAGGGCAIFSDRPACDETMTLAKKAITALEACTTPAVSNDDGRKRVQ